MKVLNACLLSAVFALVACAGDVSGTWTGTLKVEGQAQDDTVYMVLKQDGGKLTGTAGPTASEQMPIEKGVVDGNKATMELAVPNGTFKFDIALDGDHLKGDVTLSAGGQTMKAKMDATRTK